MRRLVFKIYTHDGVGNVLVVVDNSVGIFLVRLKVVNMMVCISCYLANISLVLH